MRNLRKGFVLPLLLAIIAVLLVGGGAYVYTQKKSPSQSATNDIVRTPNQVAPEIVRTIVTPALNESISETNSRGISYSHTISHPRNHFAVGENGYIYAEFGDGIFSIIDKNNNNVCHRQVDEGISTFIKLISPLNNKNGAYVSIFYNEKEIFTKNEATGVLDRNMSKRKILKFDEDCSIVWETFNETSSNEPDTIITDREDNLYVLTYKPTDRSAVLYKIDGAGNIKWFTKEKISLLDYSGHTRILIDEEDVPRIMTKDGILSFDPSSGKIINVIDLERKSQHTTIDNAGAILVAGGSLSKYTPAGQKLWSYELKWNTITNFIVDNAGNSYLTGQITSCYGNCDDNIYKIDSNGNLIWKYYPRHNLGQDSLALDAEDNLYIAGIEILVVH